VNAPQSRSFLTAVVRLREFGVALALAAVSLFFASQTSAFLSPRNWQNLTIQIAIVIVVGVGMTVVVLTRNIDLSVGSIVALSAFTGVVVLGQNPELSWVTIAALTIGIGFVCGLLNGILVAWARIPAIIATLATLNIYRGIVFHFSEGRTYAVYEYSEMPLLKFSSASFLGIPSLAYVALGVALIGFIVLRWTVWGRDFYAIGSNPDAARYAGIPARTRIVQAFVISGVLSGLGGLMFMSRFAAVTPSSASGFEFVVISAVVIGGVNLFGGSGTIVGMLIGALLIKVIENGFTLLRLSEFWRFALQGFVIILAVALDAYITSRIKPRRQRYTEATPTPTTSPASLTDGSS